ncbi:Quinic acid utilization activator, partial [Termitomyces sp. J132]
LCVDYWGLNKVTKKNQYPLLLIRDLVDHLCSAKVYTKINFCSSYNNVHYGDISYAPRRDVDSYDDHPPLLSAGTNLPQQDPARTGTRSTSEQSQESSEAPTAPPKKKPRREKPRIELASDQPPTTQGKPRARVYVACIQCRSRKTRCDGAKPICHNCSKRTNGGNECNYDAVPKRRGPDKTPGGRQRIPKDLEVDEVGPVRRRRRRYIGSRSTTSPENHPSPGLHEPNRSSSNTHAIPPAMPLPSPETDILYTPVNFSPIYNANSAPAVFTGTSPNSLCDAKGITSDIRFLFNTSNYWFSFFYLPTFNSNYFDPVRRERMQPSLILALLAMSTFWQSSEAGLGHLGRERALRFRDEAQSALDASFNAGWIDETLAQAAWLLALFEVCAHPLHSSERTNSSLVMLDSIIRSLSLTFVDADNPKTTKFSPGCSCRSLTLITYQQESSEQTPLWTLTPAWNDRWNDAEIKKESCRRLCWSSMILAAGHVSYTTAHRSGILKLFISDPANYALLLSGESIAYSPALSSSHSSKDTIWALHDRSFLLWHSCSRMRSDTRAPDDVKAHFAMKAWLEADIIEAALNRHTCRIERQFIFQAREYIFNTRMCISYEFQRYIPLVSANVSGLFHRSKAEEWLTHQATVADRFMCGLHTITGNSKNLLARRPFYVFWFMGQISRALGLWECDRTLTVAMDVCKAFLPALDYLTALWPCPEQRYRYEKLRERLTNACFLAGVNPPPPPNLRIPLPSPALPI